MFMNSFYAMGSSHECVRIWNRLLPTMEAAAITRIQRVEMSPSFCKIAHQILDRADSRMSSTSSSPYTLDLSAVGREEVKGEEHGNETDMKHTDAKF
ncbi:hypothetical protein BHM03_00004920 [Ensete ventricosum]|nr:hypothetical protein BHM03_00004920 [Ensete ventricosum]